MTTNSLLPLLRLLQLVSPSLPVGAYSYSQGLEWAVEDGLVTDLCSTQNWIADSLDNNLTNVDGPILTRMYQSWQHQDLSSVHYWNDYILACRETRELQAEDQHLGMALGKVLEGLDIPWQQLWGNSKAAFVAPFSLAAVEWNISLNNLVAGYLWTWLENQVLSAMKLVPLGQLAGQRLLYELGKTIPLHIEKILNLEDPDIGGSLPLLAIASSKHESQYSRLFRS